MRNRFPSYIPENDLLAQFQHVDSCDSEESQIQLQNFWETAVSRHDTEGLMIKVSRFHRAQILWYIVLMPYNQFTVT